MKCPICGKEVTLENKQVGVAENGEPILNQYAVCRDCKKQWNLDKQRAKRAATKAKASAKPQADDTPREKAPATKATTAKPQAEKTQARKPQAEKAPATKAVAAKPQAQKAPAKNPQADKAPATKDTTAKPQAQKTPATKPQADKASSQKAVSTENSPEPVTRQIPQKKVNDAILATEATSQGNAERENSDTAAKKVPAKKPARKAGGDSTERPAKKAEGNPDIKRARNTNADSDAKRVRKANAGSDAKRIRKADAGSDVKRVRKTDTDSDAKQVRKTNTDSKARPARKAAASSTEVSSDKRTADSKTYGNIPSEKERVKRERMVKKGYEDMLASDPKSAAAKKRAEAAKNAAKSVKGNTKKERYDDYDEESFDDLPKFRILRVILGILSLAAGAYFGYNGFQTSSLPYYVLAGCTLVSGLLLLILQMSNTLFTYLIPMMLYTAGGVFAFLERDDDPILLYASIICVVFGVMFLILAFSSRKDEEYDEEYEDDEEDEEDEDWED